MLLEYLDKGWFNVVICKIYIFKDKKLMLFFKIKVNYIIWRILFRFEKR